MKRGKQRSLLLIATMGIVASSIILVMAVRRPLAVFEFANYTGVKMEGVALSCDGIRTPPQTLAKGESAWFKIDESKVKDIRIFYLDGDGRSENLSLTDRFNSIRGSRSSIHVSVGRGNSIAIMGEIQFSDRWTNFKYQGRIWFHRTF